MCGGATAVAAANSDSEEVADPMVKKLQGMSIPQLENMASMPGISSTLSTACKQVLKERMLQEGDGAGVAGGDASVQQATKLLEKAESRKAANNNAMNSDSDSDSD